MSLFRYQAISAEGAAVSGEIEADDRRAALRTLGQRGLFPSRLESAAATAAGVASTRGAGAAVPRPDASTALWSPGRMRRKDVTAFTRQMAALLGAAIPIPQALEGLGEEEENPAVRAILKELGAAVRTGASFSGALAAHPRLFGNLYISMVRVGEEAGALPAVMSDLATLLEHEDEVRGEVVSAVAYPLFVLGFGIVTVALLLTVVMPKLFSMLREMMNVLPWPTLVLLRVSDFLHHYWLGVLAALVGVIAGVRWYFRTPAGAEFLDVAKLRVPVMGGMLRSAALGRFARTLGTLVKSGVSLLPALRIVESTIGNRVLARQIAQVAADTQGGSSLAAPLRRLGLFPKSVVQMIAVGEETGKLDDMLLRVASIEERQMRARTKTMISLLAPALILVVGALVGFMVIALLLPIFKMSRGIQ
ncbi:MAG: type II secretion system F family protein [Verrucomicrobiae bacterium]|nr:type II secretion system F family protein [Verrucomicrobiae bacterium]